MIQVSNLKKVFSYGNVYTVALGGINMEVEEGEFVAIMGPSGCGKTTLLNILGLLDNPSEGNYLLAGMEVGHLKESQRTTLRKGKIGFVCTNCRAANSNASPSPALWCATPSSSSPMSPRATSTARTARR